MAIDTSKFTGMDGIEDLLTAPNGVTNGVWGYMLFGLTYLVLFVVFSAAASRNGSTEPEKEAFLGASIIMAPLSYLFDVIDLVPSFVTVIPTVLSVIGIIVLTRKNS